MSRSARTFVLLAALLCAVTLAGCGGRETKHESKPVPANTATAADTAHDGRAFVATFDDGPVDEMRLVRATDGGIVVFGATGLPDGTRLSIALVDSSGGARARTVATVELGRFVSQPLAPSSGPAPYGPITLQVTAGFGPGEQNDDVRAATGEGRRFRGAGMRELPDGRSVYDMKVEATL